MNLLARQDVARAHLRATGAALASLERQDLALIEWASHLATVLRTGGRLLAGGNGGSAALAEHLTAELVGRYCRERAAYSAISLVSDSSSVTAIANDYGFDCAFARQIEAHGRPGDVVLLLSTSGRSPNVLNAAVTARAHGLTAWALTGPRPNPLAERVTDHLAIEAPSTAAVQEAHQVAVHLLCTLLDEELAPQPSAAAVGPPDSVAAARPDGRGLGRPGPGHTPA